VTEQRIDTKHPDYSEEMWQKCRDFVIGGDRVKSQGRRYLPELSGQSLERYEAYKARAMFYDATSRTMQGLMGAIFRRPFECAVEFLPLVRGVVRDLTRELLIAGRVSLWVDVDAGGKPYLTVYRAEDLVNWKVMRFRGEERLTLAVLRELVEDDLQSLDHDRGWQYRLVRSDGDGVRVEVYQLAQDVQGRESWELVNEVEMLERGEPLEKMPLVVLSARGVETEVRPSPILGLVNANLSHYQSSADLENGRHYTGLPTAWVAGFRIGTGGNALVVGSEQAWVTDNPQARAGYLEFTGQGLHSLEEALRTKEHLMSVLGSRLLEGQRVGVEAAETARIRWAGESATLTSIVQSVEEGISRSLEFVNRFAGTDYDVSVKLNDDFSAARLSAGDVKALTQSWQLGLLSHETALENFKRGEILRGDKEISQEIDDIVNARVRPDAKARFDLGDSYVVEGGT
jgi:hypothetical protein